MLMISMILKKLLMILMRLSTRTKRMLVIPPITKTAAMLMISMILKKLQMTLTRMSTRIKRMLVTPPITKTTAILMISVKLMLSAMLMISATIVTPWIVWTMTILRRQFPTGIQLTKMNYTVTFRGLYDAIDTRTKIVQVLTFSSGHLRIVPYRMVIIFHQHHSLQSS